MADPATLAVIGIGASVAGGGVSAFGSLYSGQAKANQLQYQAGVAQINQKIQLQNADYARKVGEVQAQESGLKTEAVISKTRATQGASNLDVNSGSSTAVQTSERAIGQQDQSIIRSNAARKAYGFDVEAMSAEATSRLDMYGAETAKTAGEISAAGTLISTAGSVAGKWYGASSAFGSSGSSGFNPALYGGAIGGAG